MKIAITFLLALAYFVTGRLGLMLPAFGSNITLLWLPTGIAAAVLLRWGSGCWPGISLGAFAVNLAVGSPWPVALGIAVGNTLGPLLAIGLLRRFGFHPAFDRARDILLLAAAAALGMLVTSGLGVATLAWAGRSLPGALSEAWLTWWAGDALGVIAAAPLVLTFTSPELRVILARRLEFLTWIGLTSLATWVVFVVNGSAAGQPLALAFLPLPLVAWAALRFGPVGTSLGLIILSVGAAYGTATQRGPFFQVEAIRQVGVLWLYMATSAALGWLISALHTARTQATGIQRLLEQALSDVSLGVLLAGLDRKITYANRGFTRLTGYPEAEMLGQSCRLLHGPETDAATAEKLRAALLGDGNFDGEILNYCRDGSAFWNALFISPVRDERGVRTGFLGIQRDITKRKRLEQEREQYFKFFQLSTDPMCIAVPSGSFQRVNPALVRLTGYAESELLARPYLDFILPEDREKTVEEMKLQVAVRPSLEFENRYVCQDGTVILLSWMAYFDAHEGVTYAAARDITRLRQSEQALRESEYRWKFAIEGSGDGLWDWDVPTGAVFFSRRWKEMLGYAEDEIGDRRSEWVTRVHPEDQARALADTQAHLDGRTAQFVNEHRLSCRDGSWKWIEARGLVVSRDADGQPLRVIGTHSDITARRQAQLEREQLDRKMQETQKLESLGVLAGGIAHDFNNLLTAILGNASIAQIELPPGSSVQDCLEHITEASLRAADLCKQMLAYSGRGRFVVQTLDLGALVEETAQMLQISISKKAVLRFRLEKALPPIEVDATQIRQVIMNLVINASEAIGDQSGVISLSTGLTRVDRDYLHGTLMDPDLPEGEYVFLEVSDSGCGMSAETQARIFDPFFTTKFTGRGLGLAAVLGIVRGHQGALKVYSEPGRGTTFKLLFPAAAGDSEAAQTPPAAEPPWRGEGRVLVVDDEETMRSTVARMMRALGLEPVLVVDGRAAVELFQANPGRFAFVLLDLTMPHLDGEQTFAELRRLRPEVRVVLMSGFNAQEALVRFSGKGLAGFLQKPFNLDALRIAVQGVLG